MPTPAPSATTTAAALPSDELVLRDSVTFPGSLFWGKEIDRFPRKVLNRCGGSLFKRIQCLGKLSKLHLIPQSLSLRAGTPIE